MKKLAFLFCLLVTQTTSAQIGINGCEVPDMPIFMPDNWVATLEIPVYSIANNNLADPAQGVCAVRLKFDHEYLGDLTIYLTSPAGQSVLLVGQAGLYGFTDFTLWDVTFVGCDSIAVPDPGFQSVWNNNQPWGQYELYLGTYYPAAGCLENFNVGPVTGTWTITITDSQSVDVGNLYAAELYFCDPSGLACNPCAAFPEAVMTATTQGGWSVAIADTSTATTQYIIDFGDSTTFSGYPAPLAHVYADTGTYLINWIVTNGCNSDTLVQEVHIAGALPHAGFEVSSVCAGLSPVFSITVEDHVDAWHWILPGAEPSESFDQYPMVTYPNPGIYPVWLEVSNVLGLDTIEQPMAVTILPNEMPTAQFDWVQNGALVQLTDQSTNNVGAIWVLPDGSFATDSVLSLALAPQVEHLVGLIAEGNCASDTIWKSIFLDAIPPIAHFSFSSQGVCLPVEVTYGDLSENAPTAWSWIFEGGDPLTSDLPNPTVGYTQPGTYNTMLAVSNSAGNDTVSLVVTIAAPPLSPVANFSANVFNGLISCTNFSENFLDYTWFLNGVEYDTLGLDPTFVLTISGAYTITLQVWNDCDTAVISQTIDITISGTKEQDVLFGSLNIEPNPNTGIFILHVVSQTSSPSMLVGVFDAGGRKVYEERRALQSGKNAFPMDLSALPSGIYALRMQTNTGEKTIRFVVQR